MRPGNLWLPKVELTEGLEGGASVAFLEFAAVPSAVAEQVTRLWRRGTGDAESAQVPRAAQKIDEGQ